MLKTTFARLFWYELNKLHQLTNHARYIYILCYRWPLIRKNSLQGSTDAMNTVFQGSAGPLNVLG